MTSAHHRTYQLIRHYGLYWRQSHWSCWVLVCLFFHIHEVIFSWFSRTMQIMQPKVIIYQKNCVVNHTQTALQSSNETNNWMMAVQIVCHRFNCSTHSSLQAQAISLALIVDWASGHSVPGPSVLNRVSVCYVCVCIPAGKHGAAWKTC